MPYVTQERERPANWREYAKKSRHRFAKPFLFTEWLAEWAAYLLSKWTLLEVLEYAGRFSILIAVVFYFMEAPERRQQRHYQAWQVINTAQGKGGSGGRVDALEQLNADGVPLVGVDVSDAFLQGVSLSGADLQRGNFSSADMRLAMLDGSVLDDADFNSTNLRGANLSRARLHNVSLKDADLVGARMAGADLRGVILDRADLRGADLSEVQNWREVASLTQANIHGVVNPPEGFIAWALAHGAIDVDAESDIPTTTRP